MFKHAEIFCIILSCFVINQYFKHLVSVVIVPTIQFIYFFFLFLLKLGSHKQIFASDAPQVASHAAHLIMRTPTLVVSGKPQAFHKSWIFSTFLRQNLDCQQFRPMRTQPQFGIDKTYTWGMSEGHILHMGTCLSSPWGKLRQATLDGWEHCLRHFMMPEAKICFWEPSFTMHIDKHSWLL